jgi:hypothetical protein
LIGEHRFSQADIRHLFEALPNLGRLQTGSGRGGRTILRENVLSNSYQRRR